MADIFQNYLNIVTFQPGLQKYSEYGHSVSSVA